LEDRRTRLTGERKAKQWYQYAFQLCLKENSNLIITTVMTPSIIINQETPNKRRGGLPREWYVKSNIRRVHVSYISKTERPGSLTQ
jgi:hypothetical protein